MGISSEEGIDLKIGRITIVAGGTGGHIWPAIAFGEWMSREHPEVSISYISGSRPLELRIYREAGSDPHVIHIEGSPLGAGLRQMPRRFKQIVRALHQTEDCIKRDMPDLCLMFGGYVSFPALLVSRRMGIRSVMHEQNARAGRVTRFAAMLGVKIASGWRICRPLPEGAFSPVGVPIREFKLCERSVAAASLGISLERSQKVALVLAGSLGSSSLFQRVASAASHPSLRDWTFLMVGASKDVERSGNCISLPHIWDIGTAYSLADLVITRAGASTLTEIKLLGVPCVIIPWRESSGGHQFDNAGAFCEEANGMILDEDALTSDLHDAIRTLEVKVPPWRGSLPGGEDLGENSSNLWNMISSL